MKNKTTQGSGNKNLVSFGKAHSNIEDYKKQFQQSYLNIICKSINLDHPPNCHEANNVSKESRCADNMKL
jgi:hypothetical protein